MTTLQEIEIITESMKRLNQKGIPTSGFVHHVDPETANHFGEIKTDRDGTSTVHVNCSGDEEFPQNLVLFIDNK